MRDPNILLIVLDSVRARNCSIYNHDNETTPFLSSFASRATVFEQARAPSIHSVSSHASMFSGYHTEQHGVTEHTSELSPEYNIWRELSEEYGYQTGIFSPNSIVMETSNLSECFDHRVGPNRTTADRLFDDAIAPEDIADEVGSLEYASEALRTDAPLRSLVNGLYYKFAYHTGSVDPESESADVYIGEFIDWIDGRDAPWAACINLMDAHYPYVPRTDHDIWGGESIRRLQDSLPGGPLGKVFLRGQPWGQLRALESLYDGCIRQLDAALSQLVTDLDERGILDETLVLITSDHGEGFGERSTVTPEVRLATHNWGIGEVLTHVPLVVREPGQSSGESVSEPATLSRFPSVVRTALDSTSADPASQFVPDDEPVVSSTFRVRPPGDSLPLDRDRKELHFGPWRALYKTESGDVYKYARRHGDETCLCVPTAQTTYEVDRGTSIVTRVFDDMTKGNVRLDSPDEQEMSEDAEQRLKNLGYFT